MWFLVRTSYRRSQGDSKLLNRHWWLLSRSKVSNSSLTIEFTEKIIWKLTLVIIDIILTSASYRLQVKNLHFTKLLSINYRLTESLLHPYQTPLKFFPCVVDIWHDFLQTFSRNPLNGILYWYFEFALWLADDHSSVFWFAKSANEPASVWKLILGIK